MSPRLSDEGMDYTLEESKVPVSEKDIQIIDDIKQKIVDGEIKVPSTIDAAEKFVKENQYK